MKKTITALAAAALIAIAPGTALAGDLSQVVRDDERVAPAGERTVISEGHVDLGLVLTDDGAQLLARDDSDAQPVWRELNDVVFQVGDAALQTLPDNDDFAFVGADFGDSVWVVPQVEVPGVPWLGWNTQSPTLQDTVVRGVTMQITSHHGPGDVALFLQNGGLEPPTTLWSTTGAGDGSFWVDLNTHTHANWTFSEPGTHLVELTVSAELNNGETVTASQPVRFAVGDNAAADEAINDAFTATLSSESSADPGSKLTLYIGIAAASLVFLALILFLTFRRSRND